MMYRCYTTPAPPICGNGVLEPGEECDGKDLGDETCRSSGFAGGALFCTSDCRLNFRSCLTALCGNGLLEAGEQCDGSDFAGQTCESEGLGPGPVGCFRNCSVNYRECGPPPTCGNGVLDPGEHCDGELLGLLCSELGFAGGLLRCAPNCSLDTSGCLLTECGNGEAESGYLGYESCDGNDLRSQECEALGYPAGTLGCTADCHFDTSGCDAPVGCGNGLREGLEQCDTGDLEGNTCQDFGYPGGALGCTELCTFDFSGCDNSGSVCGNDRLDEGEECDGRRLRWPNCATLGFAWGNLSCDEACRLDTSGCVCPPGTEKLGNGCVPITCGNGVIDPGEDCDARDLGGETCQTFGQPEGILQCSPFCTFDLTTCALEMPAPAGGFTMGSPTTEKCRNSTREVPHNVLLTRDFTMHTTEVTQDQFQREMGYNPSQFIACGLDCPVEHVSFDEALYYCNRLSVREGLAECFDCTGTLPDVTCALKTAYATPYDCPGYRLPTEAEWEYAARGNPTTTTPYHSGDNSTACETCDPDPNLEAVGWACPNSEVTYAGCEDSTDVGGSTCAGTHPVGQKAPNSLGLYDMLGNVQEWVWDWWETPYPTTPDPLIDPAGPAAPTANRVVRGGSWNQHAAFCRAAYRSYYILIPVRNYRLGFRPARTLAP